MTGPDGSIYLTNTSDIEIKEAGHALNFFKLGSLNRHTAQTAMNDRSSRSHAIVIFTLTSKNQTQNSKTLSQLYLCDLAGSENVSKSEVQGESLIESGLINKSLHQLSNVISALNEKRYNKDIHIPYRNSKLTRLLEKSLGGNSYTCMLLCVSNKKSNLLESFNTLNFGQRASTVQNKPRKNELVRQKNEFKEM